jgi:hypothetical protein
MAVAVSGEKERGMAGLAGRVARLERSRPQQAPAASPEQVAELLASLRAGAARRGAEATVAEFVGVLARGAGVLEAEMAASLRDMLGDVVFVGHQEDGADV